jgi:predicted RNA-binding protein with RPS1 domain
LWRPPPRRRRRDPHHSPLLPPTQQPNPKQTAVEAYGAFVNVGARSDGLVHVSQLADGYVRNVADVVAVGAQVKVKVMSVDAGSGRLALTMKGVEGNPKPAAPAGGAGAARGQGGRGAGAGGRGGQRGGQRGASSQADAEADAADELEANEAFVEGITLRFDDAAAEGSAAGYGEADVEALEMLPASGAAALAVNDLVEGVVKEVQDFGVIVEFAGPDGAAAQGLLHVSEMAAPAAKLPQGDDAAANNNAEAGGEAEFAGAEYEDVGGVDDPKKYYAAGDKVRAFVLDVAESGGRAELTQFVYDEADGALLVRAGLLAADDDGDRLLERVARAAGGEAELPAAAPAPRGRGGRFAEEDSEAALADVGELSAALPSEAAEATLFYGQASSYPDRAVAGLVSPGAPLAPGAFPDRPLRAVKDVSLMTPQVGEVEVGDGGEESELVDFWTLDYAPADSRLMRKGALRRIGARLEKADEEQGGGWSVQPIEGAEEVNVSSFFCCWSTCGIFEGGFWGGGRKTKGGGEGKTPAARSLALARSRSHTRNDAFLKSQTKKQASAYFELLSPVGGADVDAIVDDLLADDEDLGEAELPALAMRRPAAVFAAATGEN